MAASRSTQLDLEAMLQIDAQSATLGESGRPLHCRIVCGDSKVVLKGMREEIDLILTSPPYADARKSHYDSVHPDKFPEWFLAFNDVFYKALKTEGNFVLNIKDRVVSGTRNHFVWKTVQALEAKGWKPIDDYVWHKINPMPGYWPTRLRDGWEYCFHLAKVERPYINQEAVKIPMGSWADVRLANLNGKSAVRHNSENKSGFGRDLRKWVGKESVLPSNVLSIPLVGVNKQHPAVFPVELPRFFIKLLSTPNAMVLDPFAGSGTTGIAALEQGRSCILVDNNKTYCNLIYENITDAKIKNVEVITEGF
jgi:DNA modification methylase